MSYDPVLNDQDRKLDEKITRALTDGLASRYLSRSEASLAGVPEGFAPSATSFAVTDGHELAYLAHPHSIHGAKHRGRWTGSAREGHFLALSFDGYFFYLIEYGDRTAGHGRMWAIERRREQTSFREVLALDLAPILFNDHKIAQAIAILCHPEPREEARRLHWMPSGEVQKLRNTRR